MSSDLPGNWTIFFHSPCFDGIASAVLMWDFLEARQDCASPQLEPVNYHLRDHWLAKRLSPRVAVVDFLYHPAADFWADHHATTFLTAEAQQHYEARRFQPNVVYDAASKSCAGVLFRHLSNSFEHRSERYSHLVGWAEVIDSAGYSSADEVLRAQTPALKVSASLGWRADPAYCTDLVRRLRTCSLDETSRHPDVEERFAAIQRFTGAGLERIHNAIRLSDDGIAQFDVNGIDVVINRYSPYLFCPQARYSAGIVRTSDGARINAMRNPWKEFPSVHLGRICERLGGGGHERVGSIVLPGGRAAQATEILGQLISAIRQSDVAES